MGPNRAAKVRGPDAGANARCSFFSYWRLAAALWTLALIVIPARAQSPPSPQPAIQAASSQAPEAPSNQTPGTISGSVVDRDGAVITNAQVTLTQASNTQQTKSGSDGSYTFTSVSPGSFDLVFAAPGFADERKSGVLQPGQDYLVPQAQLVVATTVEVDVKVSTEQVAEDQIHVEEQQHVLGVFPNYYVSYVPNAAPLNPKQKFELAWKQNFNPVSFAMAGVVAGIEQANNSYSGYGQGMEGYAKRFGATYADFTIGTFIGDAILPSLLKQDPRYFYKGTGTKKSRLLYAISMAVICKGDNGRWQPNYSSVLGGLAAGGISNLYYPASSRNGAALTFENGLIGIGGSAAAAIFQEFFSHKLTPHSTSPQPAQN